MNIIFYDEKKNLIRQQIFEETKMKSQFYILIVDSSHKNVLVIRRFYSYKQLY